MAMKSNLQTRRGLFWLRSDKNTPTKIKIKFLHSFQISHHQNRYLSQLFFPFLSAALMFFLMLLQLRISSTLWALDVFASPLP